MRKEEYKELYFKEIKSPFTLMRRDFLKLFGGGIIIFFSYRDSSAFQEIIRRAGALQINPSGSNAFLKIGENGRVTCFTGKIEMGQGIITSFAQIVAEELDVAVDLVDMILGDTDLSPWDLGTFGSMSIRFFCQPLREAASQAKQVLIELASEHLKVPAENLVTKNGIIFEKEKPENSVSYAQIAKGQNIEKRLDKKFKLKNQSEFSIIGKPSKRPDASDKVTGKARYAGDITLPEMLYAKILRPPAHKAKLKNIDTSETKKIKDVIVVEDNDLIAVLHKYPDEAEKALAKIKAEFEIPETKVDEKNIFSHLLGVAPEGKIMATDGDIEKGKSLSSNLFEETYLNSYVAHAPIEPHTAVARMEGGKITVWASTQTPFLVQREVADALKISSKNIRIITPFLGGGFGGKTVNQQATEAARLAKLVGKPVMVAWSREEEFFFDAFRPAAIIKINSGTTIAGKISYWDFNVYFAGERGSEQFYDIQNQRSSVFGVVKSAVPAQGIPGSHPFATGPWRAPAVNTCTFARESHIDIMALKSGNDPVQFRLDNLKDQRMINAIKIASEKFGWASLKSPSSRGYGIACSIDSGTYVVTMTEVKVDKKTGQVKVKRILCVQDMGLVINPEGAKMQIEGCITMGLGYALSEEIRFRGGRIIDLNFDTYEIPRFSWLPEIETVLIDNKEFPPQGGGEPAITCMGAVIANAIFDATGARLFQLPMTAQRIKEAIET
ncbi:MAG: hypothetical protein A3G31_03995 [Candidatus Schekmanbacteria bacterium RIFCSPLOWO2_12_FULL_38_15]|uniref:Aldehyde oxidase/xanthine dehydrogenase a/b hammerhead domain-containing protein n=1 Tax=Candidatus Schekmanbacteria bacterium RIFCSPLOWO2_12_FULL_38_15 TaxID=1817883 RepID=A0A1F7SM28_9BACT|nr:MAG: hypothetical protein A3G31_03995 [Candidatus Schekmanbacteria bacterium RIFCSPLOWO2_12_FULL_38_15]